MYLLRVKDPQTSEPLKIMSFLSPEQINARGGLPPQAILGMIPADFESGLIPVEQFRPNRPFIDFMHHVIKTFGPQDASLQAAAARQKTGWIYIIDLRTPDGPQGRVPPEDIVGAFEIKDDGVSSEGYQPMGTHRIFTTHGPVRLPPFLHDALIRELMAVS